MFNFIFFWIFWFLILTRFDFYAHIVPFHSQIGNVLAILIVVYYLVIMVLWIIGYFKNRPADEDYRPTFIRQYWIDKYCIFIQLSPMLMYLATGLLWNYIK